MNYNEQGLCAHIFQRCKQISWKFIKMCSNFLLLFIYSTILCVTVQLEDLVGDKGRTDFNGKDLAECH